MQRASVVDRAAKRCLDAVLATGLLVLLVPVVIVVGAAIKLDSPGPILYRCRRIGLHGREFAMLKFRKMWNGAAGPALTAANDDRFTRVGRLLARTKLDEIPQLWNVLKGDMSLVGPRPEDPAFVEPRRNEFAPVMRVRPGITGLSQLAFARESEILDAQHRIGHYERRILPQKLGLDTLYAERRSIWMDLDILGWTAAAVLLRRNVAVHRIDGRLTLRKRPKSASSPVVVE
jgi:lipopolysaccharide/colanic/teichoic acid biosynthesis glycosyltransferase